MKAVFLGAAVLLFLSAIFAPSAPPPSPSFEDRTARSGIAFVLRNAATPERHQIETMAGGVAVFDYDNDGYPDIYFTNGAEQPSLEKTGPQYRNRLYRNRHDWTFEDVTAKAGVGGAGYNIGAAAGDYDNDGFADLFVTGVNGNTLFHNRGDGEQCCGREGGLHGRSGSPLQFAIARIWVSAGPLSPRAE